MAKLTLKSVNKQIQEQQSAVSQLTEAVNALRSELSQNRARKPTKANLLTVEGTKNPEVIARLRKVYGKKKYADVVKVFVKNEQSTPQGHIRLEIAKTKTDGEVKEHPFYVWCK